MNRILLTSFATLVLVLCLTAAADAAVKETIEKTVPIAADGRLSVQNVNGAIEISGWDRPEVHVVAIKKARDRDELEEIEVEIIESGDHVKIRTHHGERRGWMGLFTNWFNNDKGEVRYEIRVPSTVELDQVRTVNGSVYIRSTGDRINAEAVNGSLTLENVSGPLRLSTVNGTLKVHIVDMGKTGGISMNTVNGSVRLNLPADCDASFAVKSVNGSIDTDFNSGRTSRFIVGRSMRATLGSGEIPVDIKTVNGSVVIRTDGSIQSASR
jgi:DUF4097 and DUF4098 domain-containing protein YvlB